MITYLLLLGAPVLLALAAQGYIRSSYNRASQIPARMSGAMAARRILDSHGLRQIPIEESQGHLSDHYDPTAKVVRLSSEVYQGQSIASVGIAAHEVGHALQDAKGYAPLVIRNAAVPTASLGGSMTQVLLFAAFGFSMAGLFPLAKGALLLAVLGFTAIVFFQLVNLPVEFNASSRAKTELVGLGIVNSQELGEVSRVLTAAAMTYVAGTLQSIGQLLYYLMQLMSLMGGSRSEE